MAEFDVTGSWNGGYQATVKVMNHGTTPINGWTVSWTQPAGQTVGSLWNGTMTQDGSLTVVRNADWNRTVPADGSTTFGLTMNVTGSNPAQPTMNCSSP
ncbi:cellulose binding domain-containing protein [Kutzneria kofuensis]